MIQPPPILNDPNSNDYHRGRMSDIALNPDQLKEILKSIIIELLRDSREEFSELLAEVIEDIALERAIVEGESTELVSREAIFKLY
jgi:hypothetical protein